MEIAPTDVVQEVTALSIEPASAWDILFLVGEVFAGTRAGHFSQGERNAHGQITLALRCCKAILSRKVPFRRFGDLQFIVARLGGGTTGAALASTDEGTDGACITTIEYVVVDSRYRRAGIAAALVRHFMSSEQHVRCWCTPKSTQMQNLLRKLRFKRLQKATSTQMGDTVIVAPALWQWTPITRSR